MKLVRETRLPGTGACSGGRGSQRGSPPPGSSRPRPVPPAPFTGLQVPLRTVPHTPSPHAPCAPAPPTRRPPACQSLPQSPTIEVPAGTRTVPHTFPEPDPRGLRQGALAPSTSPGPGMAASGSQGPTPVPARRKPRRPPPPPAGPLRWEMRK